VSASSLQSVVAAVGRTAGTRSVGHASVKLKSGLNVLVVCLKARIGRIWAAGERRQMKRQGPNENCHLHLRALACVLGVLAFPLFAWCAEISELRPPLRIECLDFCVLSRTQI